MSCPHGEWHEEDCEICQSIDDAFEAGRNLGKARIAELEAAIKELDNRRCEDCADHGPCDRFSDSFLAFMRDRCNGKPVSCCFWTARAEEVKP